MEEEATLIGFQATIDGRSIQSVVRLKGLYHEMNIF
jgi:hypothetical protein